MARRTQQKPDAKVGDTIEIPNVPSALVRLPDGTVVTARGSYVARHPGEHVLITADEDGKTTETKVAVAFTGDQVTTDAEETR